MSRCYENIHKILDVGEVSHYTGYTKSTVSRLLSTLEKNGCVTRTEKLGKYQPGYRTYLWGIISAQQNNLSAIVRSAMEKLRDQCGEEVALYGLEGARRDCTMRVESVHEIA